MNLTVAVILGAIANGATSLSAIYHQLGGKGNVSGGTTKKMRALVPDIADRLKAAKAGTTGTVTKTEAKAEAPKAEAPKAEAPAPKAKKEKKAKVKTVSADGNPFRANSKIGLVFKAGNGTKARPLNEVLDEVAKSEEFKQATSKDGKELPLGEYAGKGQKASGRRQRAYWQYTMIASEAHPTNKGRVRSVEEVDEETGKPVRGITKAVRFEAVTA